jgi:hypothetical protein
MTEATILHEAEVELWEAVAYYEEKAPWPGRLFLQARLRAVSCYHTPVTNTEFVR